MLNCNFSHLKLGWFFPAVTVIIIPTIHTNILLVKFAIALAKALIYLVTVTPEILNNKIPRIEVIPKNINDKFYDNSLMYTVNPSI